MAESIDNSRLTENHDWQYISNVVNQVLEQGNKLASVKDFQSALKEVSTAQGREVQMNLVTEQNQIVGFNFSFKGTPNKCTKTMPLKQQQMEEKQVSQTIIIQQKQPQNLDVTASETEDDIGHFHKEELDQTIPLMPIAPLSIDSPENLNSSTLGLPMNLDLARAAQQLASSNELNGLWIAGTALKAVTTAAKSLETESKPDIQSAGQAIIKGFEQVLPQQFEELKNGGSPKLFNWKDSHSGKSYQFEFEAATFPPEGKPLKPATLKGFEESGNNFYQVFAAQLVEPKSNRWSIEQCDFNLVQLRSLSVADKSSRLALHTDNISQKTHTSAMDFLGL